MYLHFWQTLYAIIILFTLLFLYKNKKDPLYFVAGGILFVFVLVSFIPKVFGINNAVYEYYRRSIGFCPSYFTVFVYLLGTFSLYLGYFIGKRGTTPDKFKHSLLKYKKNLNLYKIKKIKGIMLIGYFLSLSLNIYAMFSIKAIPLFDMAARWELDPKIVFLATFQVFFCPMLLFLYSLDKKRSFLPYIYLLISVVGLGLTGARNMSIKVILTYFITLMLIDLEKINKIIRSFLFSFLFFMGLIGFFAKSNLYNKMDQSAMLPIILLMTDPLGAMNNLENIIKKTNIFGYFHGELLLQSIIKMFPGNKAEVPGLILGRLVGYRAKIQIGSKLVSHQLSLSPTLFGIPYADFGLIGVLYELAFLGFLSGILFKLSTWKPIYIPLYSLFVCMIAYGTYGGIAISDAMYTVLCVIIVIFYELIKLVVRKSKDFQQLSAIQSYYLHPWYKR